MTYYAKKVDANQASIVKVFRQMGFSVQHLHTMASGCPDLMIGKAGINYLVEIKDGSKPPSKSKLNELQEKWFREWNGQAIVIKSIDEAIVFCNNLSK